jgi:endonuclease/exonuclease/phosphatase family metal-dependent hydrolase
MMNNPKAITSGRIMKVLTSLALLCLVFGYCAPYFHPDTVPFLPFFGLSYPIWVLVVILFTFFWFFKKSNWKYICLILLVIGIKFHLRLVGLSFFQGSPAKNSIYIMSYNVRLFGLYDDSTTASRDHIFQFLRAEQPDVACFQEYYRQDKPTEFETFDSIKTILKSVDYHERSAHNENGRRNFGIAIFSKYPMIARGDVIFESQSMMDFNYCIFADIVAHSDTFRIYNVHLQSIRLSETGEKTDLGRIEKLRVGFRKMQTASSKRADQARKVIEHMESSPYPVLVCGDFNDTPMSYTYNQFQNKLTDGFREASWGLGSTYNGRIPAGRIDYIFRSEGIECSDFKIFQNNFSDHKPIRCRIVITPNQ